MKNPFPGMNPYLEQYWGDVHTSFMVYARDQINEQLPGDLQARVEEGIAIDTDTGDHRVVFPDVRVVEEPGSSFGEGAATAVAVAEPCLIPIPDEQPTQRHIEIIDPNSGNRVVTAIEVLSLANKSSDGRRSYRQKQRDYIEGGVNLVEIDLLRSGEFVLATPESCVPAPYRGPYRICIRRLRKPWQAEMYRVPLHEPLPNIPIPLRPSDRDIVLQLQPLIDECYRKGRYASIDYRRPPTPKLSEDDERWADQLLREQGLR